MTRTVNALSIAFALLALPAGLKCQARDTFADKMRELHNPDDSSASQPPSQDARFVLKLIHDSRLALSYLEVFADQASDESLQQLAGEVKPSFEFLNAQMTPIGDQMGLTARARLMPRDERKIAFGTNLSSELRRKDFLKQTRSITREMSQECKREQAKGNDQALRSIAGTCIALLQRQSTDLQK